MRQGRFVNSPGTPRRWILPVVDASAHAERARRLGFPPLVAQLLAQRGIESEAAARQFLSPDFRALHPPDALPGAVEAAERLVASAQSGRKIVVYGDYDVDGVTGTTILWRALRQCGANVDYYIPHRRDEGYGLNAEALSQLRADGAEVIITVDCGIAARETVAHARGIGLEVIVTDHHEPRETLPEANVIVHPRARGSSPNPDLCGAAVALKVAWALAQNACGNSRVDAGWRELLLDFTALAALGLIADVVPLVGENRVLTTYGLRHLSQTRHVGLRALIEASRLADKARLDAIDVGFVLAPRLNAVGRMGHAKAAVELFTTDDPRRAAEIALELNARNRERQALERRIVKQAEQAVIDQGFDAASSHAIVLAQEDWHPGVIGIVASRMVDRFRRPTIMIALEDGSGQGSGRSIDGFPLHTHLAACAEHLISHGGHAMAAGVRIGAEQVEAFREAFVDRANQHINPSQLQPTLRLDAQTDLEPLDAEFGKLVQQMGPFGCGNPRIRLATTPVTLAETPRTVGKDGKHLKLMVRQGAHVREAIAFNRGSELEQIASGKPLEIAFEPELNSWQGRTRLDLRVIDWREAAS